MKIVQVTNDAEKQYIARSILEALPDWFGIPEAREEYIKESLAKDFFCAYNGDIHLFRLRPCKRESMIIMTEQMNSIFHLDSRNLRYFLIYGMNGILAKYM